jgi:hypothetical protein
MLLSEAFELKVKHHAENLGMVPRSAEDDMPIGQALMWLGEVYGDWSIGKAHLPVARQIARLCGDDSQVRTGYRQLSDAVGWMKMGDVRRAVERLCRRGWLEVVPGEAGLSRTLFRLC